MVVGTPGGTTIPTSVFQSLVNIIEFRLSAEDAVNTPKFHHQWLPDTLKIERGFPDKVVDGLRKMGYTIDYRSAIGRTELILVLPDGKFEAIADHRGDDSAAGW
jgi:gamma-glutamyltranspeptidase/glutathione hydrolase